MKWYILGAVKSYYLCQSIFNENCRELMKELFNNLFNIIHFEKILVDDDKLLVNENDLEKIHNLFHYYIQSYHHDRNVYPVTVSDDAYEVESYSNDFILNEYTRNFVRSTKVSLEDIFKKKEKQDLFKRHLAHLSDIHNKKRIISFDFEYNNNCVQGITEIGLSVYYPQSNTFEYKHYIINSNLNKGKKRLQLEQFFQYGESEHIHIIKALNILRNEIKNADYIIGHDIINEFKILKIQPDWDKIVDTKFCDVFLNQRKCYFSLGNILKCYGFKCNYLHNAGNDAALALQLTLVMYQDLIEQKIAV